MSFLIGYGGYFLFPPTVSVVMPVYNREKLVGEAIESILNQSFKDFEFIIVDDGSTDNTLEVVRQYAEKDNRIKIIVHEQNCGVGCARNTAQRAARGKYLSIMDSDDVAVPTKLETQVQIMTDYPSVTAVNGKQAPIFADLPVKENAKEYSLTSLEKFPVILFFGNLFGNSGAMVRRSFVVDNNIWYDPSLMVGEDYDYWLQIIFAGGQLIKTDEYMIKIRKTPGSATSSVKYLENTLEVKRRVFDRFETLKGIRPQWSETILEQCHILKNILQEPKTPEKIDMRVIDKYYNQKCLPDIPNKIFANHSAWSDFLELKEGNRLKRHQSKDFGTYKIVDDILTIKWDRYGTERFILGEKGLYEFINPTEKVFHFEHPHWSGIVKVSEHRLCRISGGNCATVLNQSDDMITVKWDIYGTETFKYSPKTKTYKVMK